MFKISYLGVIGLLLQLKAVWQGTFPHRRLRKGLLSPPPSHSGLLSSASGSPDPFSTSPRHLRLATADALSVYEPSQRFSCSRRLVLAESPIIYLNRTVFLKIKHSLAQKDTPSMCTLSLPGSHSSSRCGESLGSRSLASRARKAAQACLMTSQPLLRSRPLRGNAEIAEHVQ